MTMPMIAGAGPQPSQTRRPRRASSPICAVACEQGSEEPPPSSTLLPCLCQLSTSLPHSSSASRAAQRDARRVLPLPPSDASAPAVCWRKMRGEAHPNTCLAPSRKRLSSQSPAEAARCALGLAAQKHLSVGGRLQSYARRTAVLYVLRRCSLPALVALHLKHLLPSNDGCSGGVV